MSQLQIRLFALSAYLEVSNVFVSRMKFQEYSFHESLSMILADGQTEGHDGPSGHFWRDNVFPGGVHLELDECAPWYAHDRDTRTVQHDVTAGM